MSGKNLTLDTKVLQAEGGGNFNIVNNVLDYVVNVVIPEGTTDIKGLKELQGVSIPIKLQGDLLSPNYTIDMAGAVRGVAQQKLQEEGAKVQQKLDEKKQELNQKVQDKIGEQKKELNDKVQKKLQKGLSDFFGGGNSEPAEPAEPAP